MFCKTKIILPLFFFLGIYLNPLLPHSNTINDNVMISDLNTGREIFQKFSETTYKDPLLNWFAGASNILLLISKIDQTELAKMSIQCSLCLNKQLSCAEFAGHVLAADWATKFEELKGLLLQPCAEKVNSFMVKTSNNKKIPCPLCEKFTGWKV